MISITIPKKLSRIGDLVLIPKKDLEALIDRARNAVGEKDILRWSREARAIKRAGNLSILRNLRTI
jgi:hypothetical protein